MKKTLLLLATLVFVLTSCSSEDDGPQADANCTSPFGIEEFNLSASGIIITFETDSTAVSVELEYGVSGFNPGTGTTMTEGANGFQFIVEGLEPETTYDYYIKANCSGGSFSQSVGPRSFTTLVCTPPSNLEVDPFNISNNSAFVSWSSGNGTSFQLEYGESGFALGSGTIQNEDETNTAQLTGLASSTEYDLYIRTVCGSTLSGTTGPVTFTTDSDCPKPQFFQVFDIGPDFVFIDWSSSQSAFEVEYGITGFTPGSGTVIATSQMSLLIDGLQPSTTYDFYVRANCGGSLGISDNQGPLVVTTNP